jgi:four helix bundle protein
MAAVSVMAQFERLEAWRACHRLAIVVYDAARMLPQDERYALSQQMRRAAVSVCANIAEGSAKRGRAEYRRFLDIANGSMTELRCLLLLARDLKMLPEETWKTVEDVRRPAGYLLWRLYRSMEP